MEATSVATEFAVADGVGEARIVQSGMRGLSSHVIPEFDPANVQGPFSVLAGESRERSVTYIMFLNHVADTGLSDAFTKPLADVCADVYAVPKDLRPYSSTYLTKEFMDEHASQFLPGAARVGATSAFNDRYLRNIEVGLPFGRQDGVFMSPASLIDSLQSTGNPAIWKARSVSQRAHSAVWGA